MSAPPPFSAPFAPQGRARLPEGEQRHEVRDVPARYVGLCALAMALGAVAIHFVLAGVLGLLSFLEPRHDVRAEPLADARPLLPPEPRLEVENSALLAKTRAAEREQINTYGWIDRGAGVVRVPISHAIDLIAERGKLPTWQTAAPKNDVRGGGKPPQPEAHTNER